VGISLSVKLIDCKGNYTIKDYFGPYMMKKKVKRLLFLTERLPQDTHDKFNATVGHTEKWLKEWLHPFYAPEEAVFHICSMYCT